MILTAMNYHSPEANHYYMSHSQYSDFLTCEAMAMAKLRGAYQPEMTKACLQGQMLHAWAAGDLEGFLAATPGMYKQKGGLYAEYADVMTMIAALEDDPYAMNFLQGEKRVIVTADLFGAPWRACLDVYRPEARQIIDIKTARSMGEKIWDDRARAKVTFLETYGYLRQAALYGEIERLAHSRGEGDWCDTYILAVTKESPPDKELISLVDRDRFAQELSYIAAHMPRILAVKGGEAEPLRCGTCSYCRGTKVLDHAIHYSAL